MFDQKKIEYNSDIVNVYNAMNLIVSNCETSGKSNVVKENVIVNI
ncbi:hypothetical protein FORC47_0810 [Bacillus cereus]|nr:hypothetical protein FORC47_0810 [Bacillus cereus]